jgi:hypothetical protein
VFGSQVDAPLPRDREVKHFVYDGAVANLGPRREITSPRHELPAPCRPDRTRRSKCATSRARSRTLRLGREPLRARWSTGFDSVSTGPAAKGVFAEIPTGMVIDRIALAPARLPRRRASGTVSPSNVWSYLVFQSRRVRPSAISGGTLKLARGVGGQLLISMSRHSTAPLKNLHCEPSTAPLHKNLKFRSAPL